MGTSGAGSDDVAQHGRGRSSPSLSAQEIVERLREGAAGPVLSLRTWLNNCKHADLAAIFEALLECKTVHMLSIGRNDALASSLQLAEMFVRVLRMGCIWACDLGELALRHEVMEVIVNGLTEGQSGDLATNLAFVFADVGCGLSAEHVARLKTLTKQRRLLDKSTAPEDVSRTRAPWLQIDNVFGWVMRSENITRCFWRPYQEAEFWRRGGFDCCRVPRPRDAVAKWVNPGVSKLCKSFHRGDLSAASVEAAFPPGSSGDENSRKLLAASIVHAAEKRSLTPEPAPATPSDASTPASAAPATPLDGAPLTPEQDGSLTPQPKGQKSGSRKRTDRPLKRHPHARGKVQARRKQRHAPSPPGQRQKQGQSRRATDDNDQSEGVSSTVAQKASPRARKAWRQDIIAPDPVGLPAAAAANSSSCSNSSTAEHALVFDLSTSTGDDERWALLALSTRTPELSGAAGDKTDSGLAVNRQRGAARDAKVDKGLQNWLDTREFVPRSGPTAADRLDRLRKRVRTKTQV